VHVPEETDLHYTFPDLFNEFIFYIYFAKQYNSKKEERISIAKTVVSLLIL